MYQRRFTLLVTVLNYMTYNFINILKNIKVIIYIYINNFPRSVLFLNVLNESMCGDNNF